MSRNVLDGYNKKGFIAAVERLHDELAFEFRPMLAEQVEAIGDSVRQHGAEKAAIVISGALSKQLVSWSEVDQAGKPLATSPENLRRLHPAVLYKLRAMVEGSRPSDLPANATADQLSDYAKELEAIAAGSTPLVEQQKN